MKHLRERLKIKEYLYPYAEKINPLLYSLVQESEDDKQKYPNVHVKMTKWNLKSKEVELLTQWIQSLIIRDFSRGDFCECRSVWGVFYNKGDSIGIHNHHSSYSFAYYVNVPRGSSSLTFSTSGYRVKPETGKLVVFESRLQHHVPPNGCENRCVISGNFNTSASLREDL